MDGAEGAGLRADLEASCGAACAEQLSHEEPLTEAAIEKRTFGNSDRDGGRTCIGNGRAAYALSLPNRVVLEQPPGGALPASHPAYAKGLVEGRPTAYVCNGPVCSPPLTGPLQT